MWDNLSGIINEELKRIEDKEDKEKRRREQDNKKFEDDFDNL